jgi:hypothetical protein
VVVGTARVSGGKGLVLGDGGVWPVPHEALGGARFELLRRSRDVLVLAVPPRASAWVTEASASPFRCGPEHSLSVGSRARIEMGSLAVDLEVTPEDRAPRDRAHGGLGAWIQRGLSAAALAGALAMLALVVPRLDTEELDAESAADRILLLLRNDPAVAQGGDRTGGDSSATRALDEEQE